MVCVHYIHVDYEREKRKTLAPPTFTINQQEALGVKLKIQR